MNPWKKKSKEIEKQTEDFQDEKLVPKRAKKIATFGAFFWFSSYLDTIEITSIYHFIP